MKRKAGSVGFVAATVILVLVAALAFAKTVSSRTDFAGEELERYYMAKEKQLREDVRDYLDENGFRNSGVTVTRVVSDDGRREYTVTVHHGRIDAMTEEERGCLAGELALLDFSDEQCSFRHEFLLNGL